MSKIGRKPIDIGSIQVDIKGKEVHFKGTQDSGMYILPKELKAGLEGKILKILPEKSALHDRNINRIWGLHRALLANKIQGAGIGFKRQLQINGLGYKAVLSGKKITLSLGFSHKIQVDLPDNVKLDIDKSGQLLTFKSSNKELIGHICSKIRALRPPEPYKGTGVKWVEEIIRRKAGKAKAA